ncbi:hypothetical protein PV433_03215 [Paenibacillus sp. GYB004]|uniref:hypothetical protein n=1 Tax=Paenibacillus sp. GYB004 TaxID=2994393 RepID=UPI002F96E1B5
MEQQAGKGLEQERPEEPGIHVSRRKLLTVFGMAGAALAAGSILPGSTEAYGIEDLSVAGTVYEGADGKGKIPPGIAAKLELVSHNELAGRDMAEAHPASAISYGNGSQADFNDKKQAALVSIFDYMTVSEFRDWKADQENYNVTFALQAALDAPNVYECLLPQGTYLHSGLVSDKNNFTFYSNGYARSILKSDHTAHVALHIAKNVPGVSGFVLRNVKLQGNANNLRAIQLGDSTKYVQFCQLDGCMIDGFSNSEACDIYLGSVQEIDINNTMSWRGNIGIYRPNSGYGTSIQIRGKAGYLGRHAKHGIKLDGQIDDMYIQDTPIEGNGLEGIYISDTAFKGTQGVTLYLQNAYLEANGNAGAGLGAVYAKGTSDYLKLHRIYSSGCNFADNPNAPSGFKNFAGAHVALDVSGTSNVLPNTIGITNSFISYHANLTVSSGDVLQQLKDLNAATGNKVLSTGFNYLRAVQVGKNVQANLLSSITFPNTAVLSADTNTLDDYREVDFTPTVTGNGGTVSSATGKYTKVGNVVHFWISIICQNFTSTWGMTKVSLPHSFTIGGAANYLNNQNGSGGVCMLASQAANLPTLSSLGSSATLFISGSYQTT